jgi:hypothetical protein
MKIKHLITQLQAFNPELKVLGFCPNMKRLTRDISLQVLNHNGIEWDCHHSEYSFKSYIKAGEYLELIIGE